MHTYKSKEDGTFSFTFPAKANKDCRRVQAYGGLPLCDPPWVCCCLYGLAAGKDHQFKGRYDAEKNAVIISLETDEQSALSPQKCTT